MADAQRELLRSEPDMQNHIQKEIAHLEQQIVQQQKVINNSKTAELNVNQSIKIGLDGECKPDKTINKKIYNSLDGEQDRIMGKKLELKKEEKNFEIKSANKAVKNFKPKAKQLLLSMFIIVFIIIAIIIIKNSNINSNRLRNGTQNLKLPNFIGSSLDEAETLLSNIGLTIGTVKAKKDNSVHSGNIIAQVPAAGKMISQLTPVNLEFAVPLASELIAYYKFNGIATENSGINDNFMLKNTKFVNNALFLNGRYEYNINGSNYEYKEGYYAKGEIKTFQYSEFTIALDFYSLGFNYSSRNTIIFGGTNERWFGLGWNDGELMLSFNNQDFKHRFTGLKIEEKKWYNLICSVNFGKRIVQTMLNGHLLIQVDLPVDFKLKVLGSEYENLDKCFTFIDYSCGGVFYGYIDNLRIYQTAKSKEQLLSLYEQISEDTPRNILK